MVRWHVIPNILGSVLIVAAMELPVVISIEAGLSFLGIGIPRPTPSRGTILNEGLPTPATHLDCRRRKLPTDRSNTRLDLLRKSGEFPIMQEDHHVAAEAIYEGV